MGKIDARIDARIAAPIVARIAARIAARILVMKETYTTFVKYQMCAYHAPGTIRASIRASIGLSIRAAEMLSSQMHMLFS